MNCNVDLVNPAKLTITFRVASVTLLPILLFLAACRGEPSPDANREFRSDGSDERPTTSAAAAVQLDEIVPINNSRDASQYLEMQQIKRSLHELAIGLPDEHGDLTVAHLMSVFGDHAECLTAKTGYHVRDYFIISDDFLIECHALNTSLTRAKIVNMRISVPNEEFAAVLRELFPPIE